MDKLLTVGQTAKILHTSPQTVRRWSEEGVLPTALLFPHGRRLFNPEDVQATLKKFQEAAEVRNGARTGS